MDNAKERIREQMNKIISLYDEISKGFNVAFLLVDHRVIDYWHNLNKDIKCYFDNKQSSDIEDKLYEHRLAKYYEYYMRLFDGLFQQQIQGFNDVFYIDDSEYFFDDPHIDEPVRIHQDKKHGFLDFYKETMDTLNIHLDSNFSESSHEYKYSGEDFDYIDTVYTAYNNDANVAIDYARKFIDGLKELHRTWCVIVSYKNTVLVDKFPTNEQILESLETGLRRYSIDLKNDVFRDLKKSIKLINREHKDCDNAWRRLYDMEEQAFEMATKGELKNSTEPTLTYLVETFAEEMENNAKMLISISRNDLDDELFCLETAIKQEKLLSYLSDKNLDLFYGLVLRRNLMHCEMYPELQVQFADWLNEGNKVEGAENDSESSTDIVRKTDVLFTPKAMSLWKKLQEQDYVDENYKNKVPQKKASIIADVMSDVLELSPKWSPFEKLGWFPVRQGSSINAQARNTKYGDKFHDDIRRLLK